MTNPLGQFGYSYVNQTARLSQVTYPNGQAVNFSYFGNTGDDRLQEIQNLDTNNNMQSQFDYAFNAAGQITTWQQNNSGLAAAKTYALNYDNADQLTQAALTGSGSMPKSYTYGYDLAGNRTREQINSATTTSKFNDLNQLTAQSPGGLTQFTGSLSKWAVVTVGGTTARLTANATSSGTTFRFDGMVNLTPGTNIVPVSYTHLTLPTKRIV